VIRRNAAVLALAAALASSGCEAARPPGAFRTERLTVFFGVGSDRIDDTAEAALRDFAARLRAAPLNDVAVEGYAEADGAPGEGLVLSERRAIAVARCLAAHGVSPETMRTIGLGTVEPLALPLEGRRVDVTAQLRER
jgi:outer membrane protein OmpA-like peptidoglycan-associated protein